MFEEELILFSFVKGGVRARGAKGGLPQIFEPPSFWRQQEKIGAKPVFKDVFMFFYYYYFFLSFFFMFDVFFIFIIILLFFMFFSFNLKSAQYSSYSGCLARDEFLVILGRVSYVILHICIFLLFGTALAGMGYFRS